MQQEAFFAGAFQRVDELLVVAGAQGRHDQRLRLAAREQRRAVGARQHMHFRSDRTHSLQITPIDAAARADDVTPHDVGFQALEHGPQNHSVGWAGVGGQHRLERLLLGGADEIVALGFLGREEGRLQIGRDQPAHLVFLGRIVGRLEVPRLLGRFFGEPDDGADHRLEAAMAEHDGLEHLLLGQFLGFRLDHHDGITGAGDDEVQLALGHFVEQRVQHELAVDDTHAGSRDRTQER